VQQKHEEYPTRETESQLFKLKMEYWLQNIKQHPKPISYTDFTSEEYMNVFESQLAH
jgi:hypothetical protein